MSATHSKSAFLYEQIRKALQSGRYVPGQRIDPGALAAEFNTSPTPVRFALYRLVGEGMIADHARSGLHVPLPTEVVMRDLYDWMQRLLLIACDIGFTPSRTTERRLAPASPDDDLVELTWQLFDAIARATGHRSLHLAVKQYNDKLAPVRRVRLGLIEDPFEELVALNRHWRERDIPALRAALRDYHERRKRLVPRIVAALMEGNGYLP